MRATTPAGAPHAPLVDPMTCATTYAAGLQAAVTMASKSVKASTNTTRHRHVSDLTQWLQRMQIPRNMQTVTPEDLAVYITTEFIPKHAGSDATNGQQITAPGSVNALKSMLSTEFAMMGRSGEWDAETLQGNPTQSDLLRRLTKGYGTDAAEQGYEKKAAVPITQAEILQLLQYLHQKQASQTGTKKLLSIRDGLAICILWQSCFRGFNAGGMRLDNIRLPTDGSKGSAVPFLLPHSTLAPGSQLNLKPDVTKNKKGGSCTITLTGDMLCISTWLPLAVETYAAEGQPITSFLVRPLQCNQRTFQEAGMTSSALWQRFTQHLKDCNMYTGQSLHSTRRGKRIHLAQTEGASIEDVGEAAMIQTKRIAQGYIDVDRPTKFRVYEAKATR
ncbi:MAG: hypothetical protein FRX49_12078 [Trebouxia sp. A1-2]|nr:MAG: hypothetical protein FRX49_12078 [Trebouxia sp. A1-2]